MLELTHNFNEPCTCFSADSQKMVTETALVESLGRVLEQFRTDPAVVWRAAVSLRNIAALGRK